MTIRPIRVFGDPVLATEAAVVTTFATQVLRAQVADMMETMDAAGGVGLAANQIGVLNRVFVFDTTHEPSGLRGHIINPRWHPLDNEQQLGSEGCLSIPGIVAETARYQRVIVSGRDVEGRPLALAASGLLARCIQHESDHLDGVLFLKRLIPEARKQAMAEIRASDWFTSQITTIDVSRKDA